MYIWGKSEITGTFGFRLHCFGKYEITQQAIIFQSVQIIRLLHVHFIHLIFAWNHLYEILSGYTPKTV